MARVHWAYQHAIARHVIDPGKPVQHAPCERFHGRRRDECLNEPWFRSLAEARRIVEAWRDDHNRTRPHGSRTPEVFRREFDGIVDGQPGTTMPAPQVR